MSRGRRSATWPRELEADVIVVGTHGHGWLKRVLIGSVSTHVLHHVACPVLVIRTEHTGKPDDD